jgi:hypothetical protein
LDDIVMHPFTTASLAKWLIAADGNGAALADVLRSLGYVAGRRALPLQRRRTGLGSRSWGIDNPVTRQLGASTNWPGPTGSSGKHRSDGLMAR